VRDRSEGVNHQAGGSGQRLDSVEREGREGLFEPHGMAEGCGGSPRPGPDTCLPTGERGESLSPSAVFTSVQYPLKQLDDSG